MRRRRERWQQQQQQVVALDVEAINSEYQTKAGGRCAIVAQVNGEMKVMFDHFVIPVDVDLSVFRQKSSSCSQQWDGIQ